MKCPKCDFKNPEGTRFCGNCASPLQSEKNAQVSHTRTLETPVEDLSRGITFAGRYEIIEELGKGGMGNVYRVEDTEIQEEVALKLIKPEISSDEKTINRFSNELKLARKVRHKNVCGMYDLGNEKGIYYITMEYVPGEDLKSFIRRSKQLSIPTVISVAVQVCEGLSEAHRMGVVHRDLKPSNIMIDREGNARIMDFGIARSLSAKGITGEGIIIGTPEYMSPEQAEAKEVDHRSDIYSLGIILYEMVTGQLPFEGDTPLSIAMKHKGEAPQDPRELNPQLAEDLSLLILRCMEKDKGNRFQSAEELLSEFKRIEKDLPTTTRAVPKRKPLTSKEITVSFSVKKLLIPSLVVIAALIIGLILWQPWSKKAPLSVPSDKPSIAIIPFENISGDASLDGWRFGISQLLITDLAQSKYLHVLGDNTIYGILKDLNLLEVEKYSSQDLAGLADRGRAGYIVSGSMMKAGENIIITAKLLQPHSEEIVVSKMLECRNEEEIITKMDELSSIIKENLDLSAEEIADDLDESIGSITSHSPEAFRYYTEGVKYSYLRRTEEAYQFLKKAVDIDPQFAMAYVYLAAAIRGFYNEEARQYTQKAFELSDLVSERERLRIQGDYYRVNFTESEYPRAIEAFEKLLQIYPDDNIGNRRLGIVYSIIEDLGKAFRYFKVNIDNNSLDAGDYYNLSIAFEDFGQVDKAIDVMELCAERIPDSPVPLGTLARIYLKQQKYDLALKEAENYFMLDPQDFFSFSLKGDVHHLLGEWQQAENYYQDVLDMCPELGRDRLAALYLSQGRLGLAEDQLRQGIVDFAQEDWRRPNFQRRLGYVYLIAGELDKALEAGDEAVESAAMTGPIRMTIQRRALYFKGLACVKRGAVEEAQKVATRLKALIDQGMNKKAMRYHLFLEGTIALQNKDYSDAIDSLRRACDLLRPQLHESNYLPCFEHALFYDSFAKAYYQSGDLERAREEYQKIHALTSGRLYYGDIYAKSFYLLGKIYEQQGDKVKATKHYQKFLNLWKNADPGFPEVDDAKQRLAEFNGIGSKQLI